MLRINLWSQSVSRVELDQRSRDARLRFERTDEFFVVPAYGDAFPAQAAALCLHGWQIRRPATWGR